VQALGIDVGVRKGLDLVLLDDGLIPVETRRRVTVEDLPDLIRELGPDVVAIDAPPQWGIHSGASRITERELRAFGIQCYGTPSDPSAAENAFYEWMTVGFRVFAAAETCGFRRYDAGPAKGCVMEVFPHASAVVLAGALPPVGMRKREFRLEVLRGQGVDPEPLRSMDQIDAALAALTGLYALGGDCFAPGDPREGVIVLPSRSLPPPPYRRGTRPPLPEEQPHLPGLSPCSCGDPACVALTASEFAPGHDAKRKSILWAKARIGDEAIRELRRRRWELPSELR
jgi:predicted nuclease with RNAse H fold